MNEKVETIVRLIIKDILGRSGLGNSWEEVDDNIKSEIIETWKQIIYSNL